MRRSFSLTGFFLVICFTIKSATIDSLTLKLNQVSIEQQYQLITNLPFNLVIENSQTIIPLLKKYESNALAEKQFQVLSKIYINLSLAYYYKGKYDENLKYGLKAIHLLDSLGNKSELGTMYGELGYQMKYRDLKKAMELMQKGIQILETLKNQVPLAKIYDNYGVLKEINQQVDSALIYYRKALIIKTMIGDSVGIPYSLNNFFTSYMLTGNYDSAQWYLDQSTRIRIIKNDSIGLAENYGYYGQYFAQKADYRKAIEYNFMALEIALKHQYTYLIKSAYQDLSDNYEQLNDYKRALHFHKLFSNFQDSLVNLETNKTIANLQIQYETAEKEKILNQKINQLNRQKTIKAAILIVAIILMIAGLVFYRNKMTIVQRNEKIRIQDALMEGELAERNRLALELHDGIANDLNAIVLLLQNNHENSHSELENKLTTGIQKLKQTHQMVRKLSHSLMPRSLKEQGFQTALHELGIGFNSNERIIEVQTIGLEERLNQTIEVNVFRIVQEALNNIVKHSHADHVLIDCHKIDATLFVTIEDNGTGFDCTQKKQGKGIGIKNMTNRVKMLNGNISILSEPGNGTSIEIQIPISNNL